MISFEPGFLFECAIAHPANVAITTSGRTPIRACLRPYRNEPIIQLTNGEFLTVLFEHSEQDSIGESLELDTSGSGARSYSLSNDSLVPMEQSIKVRYGPAS